jgi:hypothetical protein
MSVEVECPSCRLRFEAAAGRPGQDEICPACKTMFKPVTAMLSNPYVAPEADLAPAEVPVGMMPPVPRGVFGKFAEAVRLLATNIGLLSLLVLTIWLPGNLIANAVDAASQQREHSQPGQAVEAADPSVDELKAARRSIQLNNLIEGVFGPIYVGAVIFALDRRRRGLHAGYGESMGMGVHNWGGLWVTRFVAGLLILLGVIALIVPGIILALRYALIDPVVTLEKGSSSEARLRSAELTRGRRLSILGAGILSFIPLAALGIAFGEFVEPLGNFWLNTATDCLLDIVGLITTIVMALYYWEARQAEEAEKGKPLAPDPIL